MMPAHQRPRHGEDLYTYMARVLDVPRHQAKAALLSWTYSGGMPAPTVRIRMPVHTISGPAVTPRGPRK